MTLQECQAARLRKAREDAGFETAEEAARAIGVKYSTYIGHENGSRGFSKNAPFYAKRFKCSLSWLMCASKNNEPRPDVENHKPLSTGAFDITYVKDTVFIPVIGPVRAGNWMEVDELKGAEIEEWVPGITEYPIDWQYAFSVEGESLNKSAKYGDRLICLDLIKSGITVENGDFVIVERTGMGGMAIERTAKRVRQTAAGIELWPHSDDARYQEPIKMANGDTEEIRIIAKIIYVIHKL